MDVIVRNASVDRARAGDKCLFSGTLLAVPDISVMAGPGVKVTTASRGGGGGGGGESNLGSGEGVGGLKSLGVRDMTYRLCYLANVVQPETKVGWDSSSSGNGGGGGGGAGPRGGGAGGGSGSAGLLEMEEENDPLAIRARMTVEELEDMERMRNDPDIVRKLAQSIAPGVFGHADVKKAVLLMLMAGVHKQTYEGIHLRGDINVLIVGDPSCAKSQILKYVSQLVPRSVYTSGKSSSAAGLTATVVKDPDSGT